MNVAGSLHVHQTTYDRAAVRTGIVHIGYGAFHRTHQAVYFDDYMEATGDLGWGVAAINLRSADSAGFMRSSAVSDGYLLKSIAPDGQSTLRLVRSHSIFADWAVDPEKAEEIVAQPDVQAISMTVTESGYSLTGDWALNTEDPVIAAEIAGGPAVSVFGYLAGALALRAKWLNLPITILCCDNIRDNGLVLRRAFMTYLERTGRKALAEWVNSNVSFPCSMVDRITPRATLELSDQLAPLFPGRAVDPIYAEAFSQWVIEDRFAGPMPDLTRVGANVVVNVRPFEEAKIRILNGGHTGLAYLGALAGHTTFDRAMADPALRRHFDAWEQDEVLPGLTLDLPFDKAAYLTQIADRFTNAAIADQLERICMDGYSKMPLYVRPTVESCLTQGIDPVHGYRSIASWYIFARRAAAGTAPIPYHEPCWADLVPLLASGQGMAFASAGQLWDDLPNRFPGFVPGLMTAMQEMEQQWQA
ncbi:MAG: mannitol dehydrogenase family protein [Paracoccaceae bacterium]